MPGGSARRTPQNRFRSYRLQGGSSRAFPPGVPAAHMSVTPTNFRRKKIPWGVPTTKCAPTQLLLCTAQGTRKRQPQCAGLISNTTGSFVRHYGCYGFAVRPLGGAARAGHITDHPRKVQGTIPSTPARCPRPSAPPRYLWDLWQANVAPRAIKRSSWVHIWVPNHDSTPTRYCGWRDDRYEPPPLHNCGRGRGLPQRQEWWDGGRRVAGRPSPS